MNILLVSWYTPVLMEANKLWFYAICLSLARTFMQLLPRLARPGKTASGDAHGDEKEAKLTDASPSDPFPTNMSLVKRVVVDSCDLTLPASFVGWIQIGDSGVGMAMVVSTVIALSDTWAGI